MDGKDVSKYMEETVKRCSPKEEDNIISYWIPVREGETRVECINPKLVSQEDFTEAKRVLDRNQEIVNDIIKSKNNKFLKHYLYSSMKHYKIILKLFVAVVLSAFVVELNGFCFSLMNRADTLSVWTGICLLAFVWGGSLLFLLKILAEIDLLNFPKTTAEKNNPPSESTNKTT